MAGIAHTVLIAAPSEDVWRVTVDVERWPEWAGYMKSLVPQDDGPLAMASRVKVTPRGLPGSVWEVTEFDPPRSFRWETQLAPGLRMIGGHVLDGEDGGTRATFSLEVSGALGVIAAPLLGIVFRRNTRLATEGLMVYCERGSRAAEKEKMP